MIHESRITIKDKEEVDNNREENWTKFRGGSEHLGIGNEVLY